MEVSIIVHSKINTHFSGYKTIESSLTQQKMQLLVIFSIWMPVFSKVAFPPWHHQSVDNLDDDG